MVFNLNHFKKISVEDNGNVPVASIWSYIADDDNLIQTTSLNYFSAALGLGAKTGDRIITKHGDLIMQARGTANSLDKILQSKSRKGKRQCISIGGGIPANLNGGRLPANGGTSPNEDNNRFVGESQKAFLITNRGGKAHKVSTKYLNAYLSSSGLLDAPCNLMLTSAALFALVGQGSAARMFSFNGENPTKIAKGAWADVCDTLDYPLEAGSTFHIRTGVQVPQGQNFVGCSSQRMAGSTDISISHSVAGGIMPTNDFTVAIGISNSNSSFSTTAGYVPPAPTDRATSLFPPIPCWISGILDIPAVAVFGVGDSNMDGTGDTLNSGFERGMIGRAAVLSSTAFINSSRSGMTLDALNIGNSAKLFKHAEECSHFLLQLGANSVGGGATLATMKRQAVRALKIGKAAECTNIVLELVPRATSSANTTIAVGWELGGVADQYNAWLEAIVGLPIDDNGDFSVAGEVVADIWWELGSVLKDKTTNLWKQGNYTTDGIHATNLGTGVAADHLAPKFLALTV